MTVKCSVVPMHKAGVIYSIAAEMFGNSEQIVNGLHKLSCGIRHCYTLQVLSDMSKIFRAARSRWMKPFCER